MMQGEPVDHAAPWQVEVLRNDLGSADEKVSSIKLNGTPIGSCNPDGGDYDCTFYNCPSGSLTKTTYTPTGTTINVELVYTGHSHDSCIDCLLVTEACLQATRMIVTATQAVGSAAERTQWLTGQL